MADHDDHEAEPTRVRSADIWRRLNAQSDQISELAKGLAATDAHLRALSQTIGDSMNRLEHSVGELQRPKPPVNWFAASAALAAGVTVLGSFVLLNVSPLQRDISRHDDRLNFIHAEELDHRYEAGVQAGKLESLEGRVDSLERVNDQK